MNLLTKLSSSDLAIIAKAIQAKENLLAKIAAIDRKLSTFETGAPAPTVVKRGRKPGKRAKATKAGGRGQVTEQLLAALKDIGSQGVTVPSLASQVGMKPVNVRAWVYTTGKAAGVKAISRGVFALKGSAAAAKPAKGKGTGKRNISAEGIAKIRAAQKARWAKIKAGKTPKVAKAGKPEGGRTLTPVSQKLVDAVKSAGADGTTTPDLAKKTGMKPDNVKAWLKTTGLKLGVKKLKRGVYGIKG